MKRKLSGIFFVLSVALLLFSGRAITATPTANLIVKITSFQNDHGLSVTALWKGGAQGFPGQTNRAEATQLIRIQEKVVTAVFNDLIPGTYAVSVYHDENNNERFDKNIFGKPIEATGVSNNPEPRMRAPRFDEAKFTLREGENTIEIRVRQP